MNERQMHILSLRNTDVQGALDRCCGSYELYLTCLKMFLEDTTITELNDSVSRESWDEAFTAAHALKGLAGNMGFVPLMHAASQLVVLIRGGRIQSLTETLEELNSSYRDITDAINEVIAS